VDPHHQRPDTRHRAGRRKAYRVTQILTLKLDGITADDYLTWCRDPDPPALDFGLRSISIQADPLGDTITATLDWDQPAPAAATAATAAGMVLCPVVQIHSRMHNAPEAVEADELVPALEAA